MDCVTIVCTVVGVLATGLCTVVGVIFIPAVTVLLDTLKAVRSNRDSLLILLDKCEEDGERFLRSKTDDEWNQGKVTFYQLDHDISEINRQMRPYIPKPLFHEIEWMRAVLCSLWLQSSDTVPTRDSGQWRAREKDVKNLRHMTLGLKRSMEQADKNAEFSKTIRKEIWDIYQSIWIFLLSLMRGCLCKNTIQPPRR